MPQRKNLSGIKFGRLTAVQPSVCHFSRGSRRVRQGWECKCVCGESVTVQTGHLTSGHTLSCGCHKRDKTSTLSGRVNTTHGMTKSPEYSTWKAMITRCRNPRSKDYRRWGGSGVSIYPGWEESFEEFFRYMGKKPSPEHTIDRYPNRSGNYEPGNVRWATPTEQARNRVNNLDVSHNGETKCIAEWAEIHGVKYSTLIQRLARHVPFELAVSYPYHHGRKIPTP